MWKRLFILAISLLFFVFCVKASDTVHGQQPSLATTYRIIPAAGNTFGYDILVKGKLLIHQPAIPGIPGNKGFTDKRKAEEVAMLVIGKLRQGIMPPTVEKWELDSLRIRY